MNYIDSDSNQPIRTYEFIFQNGIWIWIETETGEEIPFLECLAEDDE